MSDTTATEAAFDAAWRAAGEIVTGAVDSIMAGIRDGDVTRESLDDRIHEEADSACIYTADCYALAWGLPDAEDAIEEGPSPACFVDALTAQAFCNVRAAIASHKEEFLAALAVAEDAAEEAGEVES